MVSLFTHVLPGEGGQAALLMVAVFLLLTTYYILKVVREPLILAGGGAEIKSYTSAAQAAVLLVLIPLYSAFANRVDRMRLIAGVSLFFSANLVLFYLAARAGVPLLGVVFFVWVGIFNLMMIAQFWSLANDVYTPEQGTRLFAIVAFGQTMGAISGGVVARTLIGWCGVYPLMLVAAGLLGAYVAVVAWVHHRAAGGATWNEPCCQSDRTDAPHEATKTPGASTDTLSPDESFDRRGGFSLIFHDRYLLLIGLFLVVLNFVNTNGEYILGKVVSLEAVRSASALAAGSVVFASHVRRYIGAFYADFFTWVNISTAIIQLLFVSRVMCKLGMRVALLVLPVVALGAYGLLAFVPVLALIRVAKIGENALDYSLNNTARQALFLPTSRAAKFKAKAAVDTVFVRAGDLLSAMLVFASGALAWRVRDFALVNIVLAVVWIALVVAVAKRYIRRVATASRPAARDVSQTGNSLPAGETS